MFLVVCCFVPKALMSKATVIAGGAMSTSTALGAIVAAMQSLGTGLAIGTNLVLAGVGGVFGGLITAYYG